MTTLAPKPDAPKAKLKTSAMIASIAGPGQRTKPAPFGHALSELAHTRPEIVGLTADLGKYTDLHIFAQAHPERFYQMGMAEQVLMAAAGGMAREGCIPFATTYAVFAARRAYEKAGFQTYLSYGSDYFDGAFPGTTKYRKKV